MLISTHRIANIYLLHFNVPFSKQTLAFEIGTPIYRVIINYQHHFWAIFQCCTGRLRSGTSNLLYSVGNASRQGCCPRQERTYAFSWRSWSTLLWSSSSTSFQIQRQTWTRLAPHGWRGNILCCYLLRNLWLLLQSMNILRLKKILKLESIQKLYQTYCIAIIIFAWQISLREASLQEASCRGKTTLEWESNFDELYVW